MGPNAHTRSDVSGRLGANCRRSLTAWGRARRAAAAALAGVWLAAAPASAAEPFTEEQVSAHITDLIAERSKDGVLSVHDAKTGEDLKLVLDRIRIVRGLPEFGWFPDVVFHAEGEPKKQYTVDFWLKPDGENLELMDMRVHKDAKPDGSSWMMITRSPLLWWWLPTLKRASAVKGVQAWQVMGKVHEHIIAAKTDGAYPLNLDDGKTVPSELVAIHQPVGRMREDGRYFACAELRKIGTPSASYAVDFKLDPDANSVTVGTAHPFEIPHADGGKATTESPCRFEASAFDVVE